MDDNKVYSPVFNKHYHTGMAHKVDAVCPIDDTQLVTKRGYGYKAHVCMACGAAYTFGDLDPDSLKRQAQKYVSSKSDEAERHKTALASLENILNVAKNRDLL